MQRRKELRIFILIIVASLVFALAGVIASADSNDVITQATLSGPALNGLTPKGVAEHRAKADGSLRFGVEVEDVNLPAGTVLNVLVNGTSIGSLTLNSFHEGELELETEAGQTVPTINAGTTVVVRTQAGATIVSGTFSSASSTPSPTVSPTPTPSPEDDAKSTVQFNAPAYTVAEDGRSLAVTVT